MNLAKMNDVLPNVSRHRSDPKPVNADQVTGSRNFR